MATAEAARQLDTARACAAAIAEVRTEVARVVTQSKQEARRADEERSRATKELQVWLCIGIPSSVERLSEGQCLHCPGRIVSATWEVRAVNLQLSTMIAAVPGLITSRNQPRVSAEVNGVAVCSVAQEAEARAARKSQRWVPRVGQTVRVPRLQGDAKVSACPNPSTALPVCQVDVHVSCC